MMVFGIFTNGHKKTNNFMVCSPSGKAEGLHPSMTPFDSEADHQFSVWEMKCISGKVLSKCRFKSCYAHHFYVKENSMAFPYRATRCETLSNGKSPYIGTIYGIVESWKIHFPVKEATCGFESHRFRHLRKRKLMHLLRRECVKIGVKVPT